MSTYKCIHFWFIKQASSSPPEKSAEELNIIYDMDVPFHAFDDMEGPKSVEDGNAGAETSAVGDISKVDEVIYSESSKRSKRNSLNTPEQSGKEVNVACSMDEHLSEPDKENIIVASKHIESKPSKSPGMPAEEVNIPYNIDDSLVHIDVTKPEMKPSENRDGIEKCIEQEVLVDLTKQAEERTSEIGKHTENDSDKPPDNQPIIESLMPTAEDNNSNEGKIDQIPSRDVKKEPSAGEVQVSGVNQSLNDPSTSWMQQETTVEQASTVSSLSSPLKSVLPDRSPLDQSPSELNRHIRTDVSESDMEEMIVRKSLLDEQATEHVAHSAPHNVHHVTDHPFTESMSEISEVSNSIALENLTKLLSLILKKLERGFKYVSACHTSLLHIPLSLYSQQY